MILKLFFIKGYATAGPKGEPGPSGRDGKTKTTNKLYGYMSFIFSFQLKQACQVFQETKGKTKVKIYLK